VIDIRILIKEVMDNEKVFQAVRCGKFEAIKLWVSN
jgi:hypothetical protein